MEIKKISELFELIKYEKKIYCPGSFRKRMINRFQQNERYLIFNYVKLLRKEEYFFSKGNLFNKVIGMIYTRRKNSLGNRIDIKILPFMCGRGVNIHHKGIIINGKIGDDCVFHGRNCIGNNTMGGHSDKDTPIIGNRVDFGVGSNVIGKLYIADDVKIGANAVVTKDFLDSGIIIGGVPAKKIK